MLLLLCCCRACFELGVVECLGLLLPSLRSLHALLTEGPPAIAPSRLRARISEVAAQSKLLAWAKALGHSDGLGPSPTAAAAVEAASGGEEEASRGPAACSRAGLLRRLLRELAEEARLAQQAQQAVPRSVALGQSNAEQAEQGEAQQAEQAQQPQQEEGTHAAAAEQAEQAAGGEPQLDHHHQQQQQHLEEEQQHQEPQQFANGSEHSHEPPLPRSTFVVVAASAEAAAALAEALRGDASLQKVGLTVQLGPEDEGQLPGPAVNGQHSNGQAENGEAEPVVQSSAAVGPRVVLLSREDLATQEAAQLLGTCSRVVW